MPPLNRGHRADGRPRSPPAELRERFHRNLGAVNELQMPNSFAIAASGVVERRTKQEQTAGRRQVLYVRGGQTNGTEEIAHDDLRAVLDNSYLQISAQMQNPGQ